MSILAGRLGPPNKPMAIDSAALRANGSNSKGSLEGTTEWLAKLGLTCGKVQLKYM